MDARTSTRFIQNVNGFIRQEAILNIPVRKQYRRVNCSFGIVYVVVLLITILQTVNDTDGIIRAWLANVDRLETTLKCRVLLDMFAVLFCGSGTNDLNLPA